MNVTLVVYIFRWEYMYFMSCAIYQVHALKRRNYNEIMEFLF